jgi:hypothetical protein
MTKRRYIETIEQWIRNGKHQTCLVDGESTTKFKPRVNKYKQDL